MNKCTICKEDNLDYDACFNCKGMGECINCCGCLEPDEEEEEVKCNLEDRWCERCSVESIVCAEQSCDVCKGGEK